MDKLPMTNDESAGSDNYTNGEKQLEKDAKW